MGGMGTGPRKEKSGGYVRTVQAGRLVLVVLLVVVAWTCVCACSSSSGLDTSALPPIVVIINHFLSPCVCCLLTPRHPCLCARPYQLVHGPLPLPGSAVRVWGGWREIISDAAHMLPQAIRQRKRECPTPPSFKAHSRNPFTAPLHTPLHRQSVNESDECPSFRAAA